MSVIRIQNMSFYAYHGCFEEEQHIGTRFRVDATLVADTSRAEESDDIRDTVNYLSVYQEVKAQMAIPSHLLEHVAHRIGESILQRFPQVTATTIRVSKLAPPLGGQIKAVSVEIETHRP